MTARTQLLAMIACGCVIAAFVLYHFPWGRY